MTSTLEKELTAAGYVAGASSHRWRRGLDRLARAVDPERHLRGLLRSSSCGAMYYDHMRFAAMYAQMDEPPWERYHPHHQHRVGGRCPVLARLVQEYRAVIDCWRSASQVPPAPEAR